MPCRVRCASMFMPDVCSSDLVYPILATGVLLCNGFSATSSTHHIRGCGGSDMYPAFVVQIHPGHRHLISGADEVGAGGKNVTTARAQVINAQINGAHFCQTLAHFGLQQRMVGLIAAD